MRCTTLRVGSEFHKESISVAVFDGSQSQGPPVVTIPNEPTQLRKLGVGVTMQASPVSAARPNFDGMKAPAANMPPNRLSSTGCASTDNSRSRWRLRPTPRLE
jgi:hypothetical protein